MTTTTTVNHHADTMPATIPAPCSRCSHLARLPLGPGDALCRPCQLAQNRDMLHLPIATGKAIR